MQLESYCFPFWLIVGLGIGAVALLVGGIAAVVAGAGLLAVMTGTGILTIGIGCLMIALEIPYGIRTDQYRQYTLCRNGFGSFLTFLTGCFTERERRRLNEEVYKRNVDRSGNFRCCGNGADSCRWCYGSQYVGTDRGGKPEKGASGGKMGSMIMMTAMIMMTMMIMMDSDDYDSDDYDDSDDCDDSEDYARAVDENEEDGTVYQLKYQPTKLDIELKYDDLILEEGDSFCVRVYDDSGKNVTVKESSDTLKLRTRKNCLKTERCIFPIRKMLSFRSWRLRWVRV